MIRAVRSVGASRADGSPGRRYRDAKPPGHHRPITRTACFDIFAFGRLVGGKANNFERTRSCDTMIAEATATTTSKRLPNGCKSAKPGRVVVTTTCEFRIANARIAR